MRPFRTEPLTPSMIDPGALAAQLQSLAESEARMTAFLLLVSLVIDTVLTAVGTYLESSLAAGRRSSWC